MRPADGAQNGAPRPGNVGRRGAYEVLAVASRASVLEQVRGHPEGVDTATLAQQTGLHPNTVRYHLDVLIKAEMVSAASDPVRKSGRPRLLFRVVRVPPPAPPGTPGLAGQTGQDGHAMLAAVLAQHLARISPDPGASAQAAGRSWITDHAAGDRTAQAADADPVGTVTALFDELGFAPEPVRDSGGWRILLHRCPFHTVAAEQPEIVCRLHLGLLQGAVDRLGQSGGAVRLQPFAAPGLCEAFVPLTAVQSLPPTPTARPDGRTRPEQRGRTSCPPEPRPCVEQAVRQWLPGRSTRATPG